MTTDPPSTYRFCHKYECERVMSKMWVSHVTHIRRPILRPNPNRLCHRYECECVTDTRYECASGSCVWRHPLSHSHLVSMTPTLTFISHIGVTDINDLVTQMSLVTHTRHTYETRMNVSGSRMCDECVWRDRYECEWVSYVWRVYRCHQYERSHHTFRYECEWVSSHTWVSHVELPLAPMTTNPAT